MFNIIEGKIEFKQLALVKEKIIKASNILLVTHRNPDGDAIGSMTAIVEYLINLDKNYTAFCFDGVPLSLEYLKYSHQIISNVDELNNQNFDLIISLDCADMKYSGVEEFLSERKKLGVELINIDHHPESDCGHININNHQASSTTEILYEIFNIWQIKISKDMATSLLAGILVDTGNFANSATNRSSLEIASDLVELGGRYGYINKQLYQNKHKYGLELWSKVLSRLTKNDRLKVAYSVVLAEDMRGMDSEAADGLTNFFNYLDAGRMVMILREVKNNEIKVSLRALDNNMDVAEFAKFFGGGGHVKAAGFNLRGRLEREGNYWKIV